MAFLDFSIISSIYDCLLTCYFSRYITVIVTNIYVGTNYIVTNYSCTLWRNVAYENYLNNICKIWVLTCRLVNEAEAQGKIGELLD